MRFIYFLKKGRFVILALLVASVFLVGESYFDDAILEYVTIQSERYFETISTEALAKDVLPQVEGKFVELEKKQDGTISYAYLNAYKTLSIRTVASESLSKIASKINDNGMKQMEIPFGYFFTRLSFLADGFKIPVKLKVYQAHQVSIDTSITPYGINSSLFEIYLSLSLDTFIQIPFQHKRIDLFSKTLLSAEIINGEVPLFYGI